MTDDSNTAPKRIELPNGWSIRYDKNKYYSFFHGEEEVAYVEFWPEQARAFAAAMNPAAPSPTAPAEIEGVGPVFTSLRAGNTARQAAWCAGGDPKPDLSFRAVELAGEVGEACNVIKKLERERHGWRGSRATVEQLAEELADVVICADLTAMSAGIDLDEAVVSKFNVTSRKVGLPQRLARLSASPPPAAKAMVTDADAENDPEFWCDLLGQAIDALDECAGDDVEGWDRQQHAEQSADRIRKLYAGKHPLKRAALRASRPVEGDEGLVSKQAALDAIQDLRSRCAGSFDPSNSGALGEARLDSFLAAWEAVRALATAPDRESGR